MMMHSPLPLSIILALLMGCGSGKSNDTEILVRCWDAAPVSRNNEYRVSLELVVIPGTEGNVITRSRKCPDQRMTIDYVDAAVRRRFEEASSSVVGTPRLGAGAQVRAIVAVQERSIPSNISILITSIVSWQPMSEPETERFIEDFGIIG